MSHSEHHFVPRFYLAQWATRREGFKGPRLTYFRWIQGELLERPATPKGAGVSRYLYTRRHAPVEQRQQIETGFFTQQVDDPGARIIQKLLHSVDHLDAEERSTFAQYLIAQRYRVPAYIDHLRAEGARGFRAAARRSQDGYERVKRPSDPEAIEDWIAENKPELQERLGIDMLPGLLGMPEPIAHVAGMARKLAQFRDCDRKLLTSDTPAIFTKGLAYPDCVIALPLSPSVAFFAANDSAVLEDIFRRQSAKDLAGALNTAVVAQAATYVYAADSSQRRFIENRLARPGTPRVHQYRDLL